MKKKLLAVCVFSLVFAIPVSVQAQSSNSISGYVYGVNRQRLVDLNIELLDDLGRTIARTLSNATGGYAFNGLSSGRYVVKVYTFGTDYEEEEASVDLTSYSISTSNGGSRSFGTGETRDIYLRLRRGVTPAAAAIFVQSDVPEKARKLYEQAVSDLAEKHESEALNNLRLAIELFPKYFLALEKLGMQYVRMNSPESIQAAEVLFANAVEVNPRGLKSWYGLAYSQYLQKKDEAALASLQKALDLNSAWPDALCLHGTLLRRAKKYAEAEKEFLKAKEVSKDTLPLVHWQLALMYGNELKRYADAAKELRSFLKLQPESKDADNIKKLIADFETKAQKA